MRRGRLPAAPGLCYRNGSSSFPRAAGLEHRMSAWFRTLVWSTAVTVLAPGAGARAAPMDDCTKVRGAAALSVCSLVVDDEKEKSGNRTLARLLRARAEMDMSNLDRASADIDAALAASPNNPF